MARPLFVFCDTDALIQFLLVPEVRPLRVLRSKYSIQPVIVPEVELELRSNPRHGARITPELRKALSTDLLQVLTPQLLQTRYGNAPNDALATAATMAQISTTGRHYQRYVDLGEAYTHAAALATSAPALSHDRTALTALANAGLPVPSTVLRAFDLVALCYQIQEMRGTECDDFRSALLTLPSEFIPVCFRHKSFVNGLLDFHPRICDMKHAPVGKSGTEALPYASIVDL